MTMGTSQNTMPTFQLCLFNDTIGGRHGCHLGYGLDGHLSTGVVGVYSADGNNVPSHYHWLGTVSLQANGDQSDQHDWSVAVGAHRQALDDLRAVFLPGPMVVAPRQPSVVGAGGRPPDRIGGGRAGDRPEHRRHHLWAVRPACGLRRLLQRCLGEQHTQEGDSLVAQLGDRLCSDARGSGRSGSLVCRCGSPCIASRPIAPARRHSRPGRRSRRT